MLCVLKDLILNIEALILYYSAVVGLSGPELLPSTGDGSILFS